MTYRNTPSDGITTQALLASGHYGTLTTDQADSMDGFSPDLDALLASSWAGRSGSLDDGPIPLADAA